MERVIPTKPMTNEQRKIFTGTLVNQVSKAAEKQAAKDRAILSRVKKVGDPTHYHISDDEPLI